MWMLAMNKHTPGPWELYNSESDGWILQKQDNVDPECQMILAILSQMEDEEDKANAQILVAAPKMLEALTQIAELTGGCFGEMGESVNAVARAAIKTATNRS